MSAAFQVPAQVIILCGPTASGKTAMGCDLARRCNGEIISADSRQVYRQMSIGTAKPTADELNSVRHHLVDIVDPDHDFSVSEFVARADAAILDIVSRGKIPFVVGGTGLYIRALSEGLAEVPAGDEALRDAFRRYEAEHGPGALHARLLKVDPRQAAEIHPRNLVRVIRALEVFELSGVPMSTFQKQHNFADERYRTLKIYLNWPREQLYARINQRVDLMFDAGLVEEVESLLSAGYGPELKSMKAIGYREVCAFFKGERGMAETVELIKQESRRYAKRQETWFKKEKSIISVDSLLEIDRIQQLIERFLLKKGSGYGQDTI